jgi:putative FmdB family regulatory protein
MPIYEYRCRDCRRKSTFVTLSVGAAFELICQHCGSVALDRLVSRVAIGRSEESRMDSLADPASLAGLDESDPKSMARWMKKMGREMGEDAGEDFEQNIDQAMAESEEGPAGGQDGGDSGEDGGGIGAGGDDF